MMSGPRGKAGRGLLDRVALDTPNITAVGTHDALQDRQLST